MKTIDAIVEEETQKIEEFKDLIDTIYAWADRDQRETLIALLEELVPKLKTIES